MAKTNKKYRELQIVDAKLKALFVHGTKDDRRKATSIIEEIYDKVEKRILKGSTS